MYLNSEKFLSNYQKAINELDHVTQVAEDLKKHEVKQIFFTGCGGAFTKFVDLKPLMFKSLSVPFLIVSPEELSTSYLREIDAETLIIAGTKTGETKELISALNKIKNIQTECRIISFIGDDGSTLEGQGLISDRIRSIDTDVNLIELGWLLQNLTSHNSHEELTNKKEQLVKAGAQIVEGIEALIPKSLGKVNNTNLDELQMWVGSGRLWGEVCCYVNYLMEEIQRIKAQAVHSNEFFHGPFEIIDEHQSVNVVVNSDSNREHDLRVVDFVKNFAKDPLIIDMNSFKFEGLDEEMKSFVEPYALNHYFDTLYNMYSVKTGRTAATRRYYRLLNY
ncbi:SIS domain-containing protein [Pediococcus acidilactici]|uniref:SIS domain-containing protein n=1 Tax=Pediococcus acidilactici TaxID=1254 RepID=UPI003565270B